MINFGKKTSFIYYVVIMVDETLKIKKDWSDTRCEQLTKMLKILLYDEKDYWMPFWIRKRITDIICVYDDDDFKWIKIHFAWELYTNNWSYQELFSLESWLMPCVKRYAKENAMQNASVISYLWQNFFSGDYKYHLIMMSIMRNKDKISYFLQNAHIWSA